MFKVEKKFTAHDAHSNIDYVFKPGVRLDCMVNYSDDTITINADNCERYVVKNDFNISEYLGAYDKEDKFEFIVPSNDNVENKEPVLYLPDYISFSISRYALTDVLEELKVAKAENIIVTKVDGNLVVKYKPSWKE